MIRTAILLFVALASVSLGHGFRIQPKIINGLFSNPSDFPFFVNVRLFDGTYEISCGGALLNDRWVLTGAHCLEEQGEYTVTTEIDASGRFKNRLNISQKIMHPLYDPSPEDNNRPVYDIGLVELANPIDLNERVRPVKLPTKCQPSLAKERVAAIGNGLTSFHPSQIVQPLLLKRGVFETMSHDECLRSANYAGEPDSIICIRSLGYSSVHMGDSGGPLVTLKDGTLAGIISYFDYAQDGGNKNVIILSQVCSSVHYHLDWISGVTGIELSAC